MSRSYKKTSIAGIHGSDGEKFYKKVRSGKERAKVRELLAAGEYEDLEEELEPWDEWNTSRDGKMWFDQDEFPKLMRK